MTTDTLPLRTREAFQTHCRAQASALYVGGHTLLCRVMGQFLCYVDGDDASVAPHLAMDGFWEAWNSVAVARHVRPGWRVVDVGANHGYFTLLLASLVGPEGRVFAIEPNPRLFALLERTVRLNGFDDRVTLLQFAAASHDAAVDLRVPREFSGDGSVVLRRAGELASCPVQQRRLDGLIDGPIDFLKIDAEGADYDVLEGAIGLLPPDRPAAVLLEHHAAFHEHPSMQVEQVIDDGFSLRYVTHDGDLAPATVDLLAADPARFWDVWLSREPRRS